MRKAGLAATAAGLVLALGGAAGAQTTTYSVTVKRQEQAFEKLEVPKATVGAQEIRLWANTSIDPDCRETHPGATLSVVQAPTHGAVRLSDEPFFAAFPAGNPRSACNSRKLPGHQAFYAAQPGFKGHDLVVLLGSSPDGHVREISFDVEVR